MNEQTLQIGDRVFVPRGAYYGTITGAKKNRTGRIAYDIRIELRCGVSTCTRYGRDLRLDVING